MPRTVHVRAVFPTAGAPSRTAIYSESGRGSDPRSFCFVIRHDVDAERIARLMTGLYKRREGWSSADALLAQLQSIVLEVERTSGRPVSLASALVEAPEVVFLVRGSGAIALEDASGLALSAPAVAGVRALRLEPGSSGFEGLRHEPRSGESFLLGFEPDLGRAEPEEILSFPSFVDRAPRASLAQRAVSALAARGGALVIARFHHLPWIRDAGPGTATREPRPPAGARDDPRAPSLPGDWRERAGAVAALAFAIALFALLSGSGPGPAEPDAALLVRGTPLSGPRAEGWVCRTAVGFSAPPLALQNVLLAPCDDGALRVVDRASGAVIRTLGLAGRSREAPVLVTGLAVVAGPSGLHAMEPESGEIVWLLETDGTPGALVVDRERLWTTVDGDVLCVSISERRQVWRSTMAETPLVGVDVARGVGVTASAGGRLSAFNPWNGKPRFSVDLGGTPIARPRLERGRAYVALAEGRIVSAELHRGRVRWSVEAGGRLTGACTTDGERLYAGTSAGEVLSVRLEDGGVVWRHALGTLVPTHLVLDGARLLVAGSDGRVCALSSSDGTLSGCRSFGSGALGTPVVSGGRVIAATAGGDLESLVWRERPPRGTLGG